MLIAWGMTPAEFRELGWREQRFLTCHWAERGRRSQRRDTPFN